jgi:uncharacterized membrane protein
MLRLFLRSEAGNMSVLFAVAMVLGCVVGALAVDEASLYAERRQMQSAVDLAALAAAGDPADATDRVRESLKAAGFTEEPVVTTGHYAPDPALAVGERFTAHGEPVNAVRVVLTRPGTLYFARGWSAPLEIGVEAVAAADPVVSFSIGSRLLRFDGGLANAVLNKLLGADISLTAASYEGLVDAQVNLLAFLDALATELDIGAGTYADVLSAEADHGQIARALAEALTGADRAAALALAGHIGHNGAVPIGKLVTLGTLAAKPIGSGLGATDATVSALQLLVASAALSDGTHQVALNVGASVPGLVGIAAKLEVGEPMQGGSFYAIGPADAVVRTAQVRLALLATLGGGAALLNSTVKLPLALNVASAEAHVVSATCPAAGEENGSATLAVTPGIASLTLGGDPARLVDVAGLLTIDATAPAALVSPIAATVRFSPAEIGAGTVKTVATSGAVTGLAAELVAHLALDIRVLGLGLLAKPLLDAAIRALLMPLAPALDQTIDLLLASLGLSLGEADVTVHSVTCAAPVLVR